MSITPAELKAYSVFEDVIDRADNLLAKDILEAETYIEGELKKSLTEFNPLPEKLQLALLKVAQYFALINSDESIVKGYKSEKMGDYSYTLADGSAMSMPDVSKLLDEYIDKGVPTDSGVFLRLRAL
ncbi:protein YqbG [Peribacillus loiseleuriae]|uniref:protein YqbG n=1 Tax=Peribacillus loiseleuriae TaxID=1679170 RepID=UPI003D01E09D